MSILWLRDVVVAFVLGAAVMFVFKPIVDSGLEKLFKKNA